MLESAGCHIVVIKSQVQVINVPSYDSGILIELMIYYERSLIMLSVIHLKCESKVNPIGIDERLPRFSWIVECDKRATVQTAYRIQVSNSPDFTSTIWDTGKVESDQSVHVEYGGPELQAAVRYLYRIRIWDGNIMSEWSEPAFWEMGLLGRGDWSARWIAPSRYKDPSVLYPCPMMRKTFSIEKEIERARVYVTGLGLYELRLNGRKVGNDFLTPGWTSYKKRIQYQTYDISDDIKAGKNTVGIILGEGWYKGHMTWHNKRNKYGDRVAALVQINITYRDGSEEKVVSDESWKASESPILFSEIYHGETYDARLEKEGWDTPEYDDIDWESTEIMQIGHAALVAQENAPARIMMEIKSAGIFKTPKGETVIDMGQNMAGFIRFRANGRRGDKIILRHFEVLDDDGNVFLDNLVHAKQRIEYILKGEAEETFTPHFTYQGFRYIWLEESNREPNLDDFTGLVLYSDIETTGYFVCSNIMVNRLQENILWSQKSNFIDIPTDCPQRSERLGWTGDAQIFASTAAYNMDCAAFFSKWLNDLRADQKDDGLVPWVIPDIISEDEYPREWLENTGEKIPTSAAWGDSAVIVPWEVYQAYGDARILKRQYESMKAWIEYIRRQGENEYLWNTGFHFGDWAALDTNPEDRFGATSTDFIATAYYAYSTKLLSKAAKVLGYNNDFHEYDELYKRIVAEFRKEFITATGRLSDQTQTSHAVALFFDLVQPENKKKTVDRFEKLIKKSGYRLWTGFVGIPYLCHALSSNGKSETALKLLFQTKCPSWLYQITKGATTIWEYWNNDTHKASFNHYAYGSVGSWLYSVLGGITIDEEYPGYKHAKISPLIAADFDYVKTGIKTLYGQLKCEWNRNGDSIRIDISVPHNTSAAVLLPEAKAKAVKENGINIAAGVDGIMSIKETGKGTLLELGSGSYSFHYQKQPL